MPPDVKFLFQYCASVEIPRSRTSKASRMLISLSWENVNSEWSLRRAPGRPGPPVDQPSTDTLARCIPASIANTNGRWATRSAGIQGRETIGGSNYYIQVVLMTRLLSCASSVGERKGSTYSKISMKTRFCR